MKEKLISLETAKILHDLNIKFDKKTTIYVMWSKDYDYTTKIPFEPQVFLNGNFYEDFEYDLEEFKNVFEISDKYLEIQFPTQSLLQKYLRDIHDIEIAVQWFENGYINAVSKKPFKANTYKIEGIKNFEECLELAIIKAILLTDSRKKE